MAGDADKELEVIASVSSEQTAQMKEFMEQVPITVEHIDNGITFDIVITLIRAFPMPECGSPITIPILFW